MNGSAFRIVERGQRYFVFKVKENINLIVLGCEMKGIQTSFSLGINVGAFIIKIFNSLEVAHVGGIQKWREALLILFIEPLNQLLLVVFEVYLLKAFFGIRNLPVKFACMMDVKLYDIKMIFIGQLMQHIIFRVVKDLARIQLLILSKKFVYLCDISRFEENFPYFLLLLL